MKRKLLLFLTIFLGLGLQAQPASALLDDDIALTLYPTTQTIELDPDREYSGSVTITNSGQKPFTALLSAAPYQVDSESYDADFSTENAFTKLYGWISFPETSYYLEPGASVKANYTVTVPEDAVGGGQYAAILARTEDSIKEGDSIQVISQVAGILYGRVNGPEMQPAGEIVEQDIPGFVMDGLLEVAETTYNTGNVDFRVSHSVIITNFFSGEEVLNADSKDGDNLPANSDSSIVLPGTSRRNVITWENTPRLGVYKVKQTVSFLDEEATAERVVIFCPSWLLFSILGLIALAILWIILAARRRRHKQPQVF